MNSSPLIAAFLARRGALRRYFAARVGDADADDLLQETYLRVAALPATVEIKSEGAYLYRLCANIIVDRLRQQRARQVRDNDWRAASMTVTQYGQALDDGAAVDRTLIARERLQRLRRALLDLPDAARDAFYLHKFEGLSHSEVAARLGISRSMVEKHVHRVMKHLTSVEE